MEYTAGDHNEGEGSIGWGVLAEPCNAREGEGVWIKVEEFIDCNEWGEVEGEGVVWYLIKQTTKVSLIAV